MTTVVLDYTDGSVYIINHDKDCDIENMLFEEYSFKESQIEWMT